MYFRLFLPFIFYIYLFIFFRLRRNITSFQNSDGYQNNIYSIGENAIVYFLIAKIRRKIATFMCRKYLTRYSKLYKLKNKYINFSFDDECKAIHCVDRNNRKNGKSFYLCWYSIHDSSFWNGDNWFEEVFDTICMGFNNNTKYEDIKIEYEKYHKVEERTPKVKKVVETYTAPILYIDEYLKNNNKLNINSAKEEEIAKLPGISIILAKKIIKYRNLNKKFNSLDEFYEKMKIKSHFQKQLNDIIYVENNEEEVIVQKNNERIVDL